MSINSFPMKSQVMKALSDAYQLVKTLEAKQQSGQLDNSALLQPDYRSIYGLGSSNTNPQQSSPDQSSNQTDLNQTANPIDLSSSGSSNPSGNTDQASNTSQTTPLSSVFQDILQQMSQMESLLISRGIHFTSPSQQDTLFSSGNPAQDLIQTTLNPDTFQGDQTVSHRPVKITQADIQNFTDALNDGDFTHQDLISALGDAMRNMDSNNMKPLMQLTRKLIRQGDLKPAQLPSETLLDAIGNDCGQQLADAISKTGLLDKTGSPRSNLMGMLLNNINNDTSPNMQTFSQNLLRNYYDQFQGKWNTSDGQRAISLLQLAGFDIDRHGKINPDSSQPFSL